MAGLIYGNVNRYEPQQIIDFATMAACKKFAVKGDATTVTVNEIKNSMPRYA
jgi:2-dehydro-3-deoxygluconokinase